MRFIGVVEGGLELIEGLEYESLDQSKSEHPTIDGHYTSSSGLIDLSQIKICEGINLSNFEDFSNKIARLVYDGMPVTNIYGEYGKISIIISNGSSEIVKFCICKRFFLSKLS